MDAYTISARVTASAVIYIEASTLPRGQQAARTRGSEGTGGEGGVSSTAFPGKIPSGTLTNSNKREGGHFVAVTGNAPAVLRRK